MTGSAITHPIQFKQTSSSVLWCTWRGGPNSVVGHICSGYDRDLLFFKIQPVVLCPPHAKIANLVKLLEAVCNGSVLTNFVGTQARTIRKQQWRRIKITSTVMYLPFIRVSADFYKICQLTAQHNT